MPLNISFESIDETQMRLEGTIVRYDGVPVYVNQVSSHDDGNPRVHLKSLPLTDGADIYRDDDRPGGLRMPTTRAQLRGDEPIPSPAPEPVPQRTIRKVINSPKLDMEPFTLGYFTSRHGVFHVSRMPARKYKQGLSQSNCLINAADPNSPARTSFANIVQEQGFYDMLVGNYPSLLDAFALLSVDKSVKAVAVHYDYYVKRHPLGVYFLHNCQTEIGISVDSTGRTIRISSEYKYLREVLTKIFPTTSLEFMEQ